MRFEVDGWPDIAIEGGRITIALGDVTLVMNPRDSIVASKDLARVSRELRVKSGALLDQLNEGGH